MEDIAKNVVRPVAEFLRHSQRFQLRFSARAQEEALAAISNFSFAPQRFSSIERPMARFVLYSRAVMETLSQEYHCPTSPARAKWAKAILSKLTGKTWVLIGMLADLSDDCNVFLRKYDTEHPDPILFAQNMAAFRERLKTEYVEGGMWLRREGTYCSKVAGMLKGSTKVVVVGEDHLVVGMPCKADVDECAARVANVARCVVKRCDAEFPSHGIQQLFGCFHIHLDKGPPQKKEADQLLRLAKVMGWTAVKYRQLMDEFSALYWHAREIKLETSPPKSDRDAWALAVTADPGKTVLREVLTMAMGFLVSETQCERTFSQERRQTHARPSLAPGTRWSCLKVMVDGPVFEALVVDGVPTGTWWHRVQNRRSTSHIHVLINYFSIETNQEYYT